MGFNPIEFNLFWIFLEDGLILISLIIIPQNLLHRSEFLISTKTLGANLKLVKLEIDGNINSWLAWFLYDKAARRSLATP